MRKTMYVPTAGVEENDAYNFTHANRKQHNQLSTLAQTARKRQTDRQTETNRQTQTHTETERQRHTDTDTDTWFIVKATDPYTKGWGGGGEWVKYVFFVFVFVLNLTFIASTVHIIISTTAKLE